MGGFSTAAAVVAGLTFGLFLPTAWSDPPKTAATPATPAPVEAKPLAIKVFRLERAEVQAIRSAWDELLGEQNEPLPEISGTPEKKADGGFGAAGFGGALGCGFAGIGGTRPVWRATTDGQALQVVIRGTERTVKLAGEIVAVLDRAEKAALPKLDILRVAPLKHTDPGEVVRMLGELEIDGLRVQQTSGGVMYTGRDADLPAVAELLKALDVPGK